MYVLYRKPMNMAPLIMPMSRDVHAWSWVGTREMETIEDMTARITITWSKSYRSERFVFRKKCRALRFLNCFFLFSSSLLANCKIASSYLSLINTTILKAMRQPMAPPSPATMELMKARVACTLLFVNKRLTWLVRWAKPTIIMRVPTQQCAMLFLESKPSLSDFLITSLI